MTNVESYLGQTFKFKTNYEAFVRFILDDPNIISNKELDYIYNLKQIIQQLMNNKSSKNKYIKK